MMRRLVLIMLLALAAPPARAEPDDAAIRGVIADQIAAFGRDDAEAAFGFAAPAIQAKFITPEIFLDMVRTGYAPVYRPREERFGALEQIDGRWVQRVLVVGPDGQPVTALYIMEQQSAGSWRIDGRILTVS